MIEVLVAAAAAGGTAVAAAAATDAWRFARDGAVGFFRRGGDQVAEDVGAQLDRDAAEVEAAEPADREEVRAALIPAWQGRLRRLLTEHPEAAEELQAWAERVREQLPAVQQQWVQQNTASGPGSTAYAAMGGNVTVYNHGPTAASGDQPTKSDSEGDTPT